VRAKFGADRLTIVAPTRRYGSEQEEDALIAKVWQEAYQPIDGVSHPVDEAAMLAYGVSSTPMIVLLDRRGVVRLYCPSRLSAAELEQQIAKLL